MPYKNHFVRSHKHFPQSYSHSMTEINQEPPNDIPGDEEGNLIFIWGI